MGDTPIPDSISSDQLQRLLSRSFEMPLSDIIPEVDLGAGDASPGGICDLQLVLMQVIKRSAHGTNLLQEFTAALYLMHSVQECLARRRKQARDNTGPFRQLDTPDREAVIDALDEYLRIQSTITRLSESLHIAFMMGSSQEAILGIRSRLGQNASLDDIRSHLMVGNGVLESLGISREDFTAYINKHDIDP